MLEPDRILSKQFSDTEKLHAQLFELHLLVFKLKLENLKLKFALKCAERDYKFSSTKYVY